MCRYKSGAANPPTMEYLRSTLLLLLAIHVLASTAAVQPPTIKSTMRAAYNSSEKNAPSLYIVNGVEATPGEFPWQVSVEKYIGGGILYRTYGPICGGTIISSRAVVTAAHCIDAGGSYRIVAGVNNLNSRGYAAAQIQSVWKAIVHPLWNDSTLENDVAVLVLYGELTWNNVVKSIPLAKLPGDGNLRGTCITSGWGKLSQIGDNYPKQLMKVDLNIVPTTQCYWKYKLVDEIIIDNRRVCAGGHDGKAACNGDSGGPLICKNASRINVFAGITSFGVECGDEHPTVFTSVAYFHDWIVQNGSNPSAQLISLATLFTAVCLSTTIGWRL